MANEKLVKPLGYMVTITYSFLLTPNIDQKEVKVASS